MEVFFCRLKKSFAEIIKEELRSSDVQVLNFKAGAGIDMDKNKRINAGNKILIIGALLLGAAVVCGLLLAHGLIIAELFF